VSKSFYGIRLALVILCAFAHEAAFAMPCDSEYICKSKSDKYVVEIQRCRYDNRLGTISEFKIGKTETTGSVKLGAAWDGDQYLAFEIHLPTVGESERMFSIEVEKKSGKGLIHEKKRDDSASSWKPVSSETITCKDPAAGA
jgi:hypothetical protein